ncbi:MAG TPA: SUMF1/EgtB/PvdO family nonheme iron enzyme, partial [Spongiibacteraceae bacterium]|nr:SUMF1/EgtB/PvdO family nonheme iron enzyme [Spongiibacteraceae bacterium]
MFISLRHLFRSRLLGALMMLLASAQPLQAEETPGAVVVSDVTVPNAAATVAQLVADSVVIKAGSFKMGDAALKNAGPVHDVKIHAFAIGKYLVTRGDFAAFIGDSNYQAGEGWHKARFRQSDRDPVVNIGWSDAQAFATWLSNKTHKKFRLPTEAEWEYAARAGTATKFYWGDAAGANQANCNSCGSRWDGDSTAPVGSFAANPWGLFDMAGNAAEWTQDCYSETYQQAPTDGSAV